MSPRRPPPWTRPDPLPGPVVTERTIVRWWEPGDAEGLHEAVDGERAALLPWLPWAAQEHRSPEESLDVIERFARDRSQPTGLDFVMGIFARGTGGVLGGTGLHRIQPDALEAEIGYWIRGDRHGEGLCTEAIAALVTSAFADWGFRRVVICCTGENRASQRVPEKLGIPLEGTWRRARWLDDHGWDDHLMYGVLAHEWNAETGRVV